MAPLPTRTREAPTTDLHVPIRTCVGCRTRAPQGELLRLAVAERSPDREDGAVVVEAVAGGVRHARMGRGAYLHPDPRCLGTAVKRRAIRRALRMDSASTAELGASVYVLTGEDDTATATVAGAGRGERELEG